MVRQPRADGPAAPAGCRRERPAPEPGSPRPSPCNGPPTPPPRGPNAEIRPATCDASLPALHLRPRPSRPSCSPDNSHRPGHAVQANLSGFPPRCNLAQASAQDRPPTCARRLRMFEKIVLAVDGSEQSQKAVPLAVDVARKSASEVVVVHVREHIVDLGGV